jgi:hypothetical protein
MRNDDYCRRQAQDAREFAEKTLRPEDKAAWLRIAHSWLSLVTTATPGVLTSNQEALDTPGNAAR